jgi:hypothetical protein
MSGRRMICMEPTSATNRRWNLQIGAGLALLAALLAFGIFEMTSQSSPARASLAQPDANDSPSHPRVLSSGGNPSSATATATAGTVPTSAFQADGGVDLSKVPDFISALGKDGQVVGYIPKSQLFPSSPPAPANLSTPLSAAGPYRAPTAADMAAQNAKLIYTVYGRDLTTVVGHEYPRVGFVPLGETPPPPTTPTTWSTPPPPG